MACRNQSYSQHIPEGSTQVANCCYITYKAALSMIYRPSRLFAWNQSNKNQRAKKLFIELQSQILLKVPIQPLQFVFAHMIFSHFRGAHDNNQCNNQLILETTLDPTQASCKVEVPVKKACKMKNKPRILQKRRLSCQ